MSTIYTKNETVIDATFDSTMSYYPILIGIPDNGENEEGIAYSTFKHYRIAGMIMIRCQKYYDGRGYVFTFNDMCMDQELFTEKEQLRIVSYGLQVAEKLSEEKRYIDKNMDLFVYDGHAYHVMYLPDYMEGNMEEHEISGNMLKNASELCKTDGLTNLRLRYYLKNSIGESLIQGEYF